MIFVEKKKVAILLFALFPIFLSFLSYCFSYEFSLLFLLTMENGSRDKKEISDMLQEFFKTGETAHICPLLPKEARIFLSLDKIKNAKGFFSSDQTLLIFKEFFRKNKTVSIQINDVQIASSPPLVIKASLIVKDEHSKLNTIHLNITLQKEADSWKIKEIKESGS